MVEIGAAGKQSQQPTTAAEEGSSSSAGGSDSPATTTSPLIHKQMRSSDRNADDSVVPFVDKQLQAPSDRFHLVYLILLLHGVGVLLPWNTFLTIAYDYYIMYKFNGTQEDASYKNNFFNYLTAFAQGPNLLLSLLNLFVVIQGGLHRRIYGSLALIALICALTIGMVFVNSESWPFLFFMITMVTVVLLNSANGIYQNSIWGLVADFPPRFTNAIIMGNNLCGILMAILYILIILIRTDIRISASVYFGLALLTVLACLGTFHFLPKMSYYHFYVDKAAKARMEQGTEILHEDDEEAAQQKTASSSTGHPSAHTYLAILNEAWRQLFDVWIVFFCTLALFPTVLLKVKLYPPNRAFDIFIYGDMDTSAKLFRQLSIFLNFNLFATVGSVLANYVQWPNPKYLTVPVLARLLFIPLFWACNYQPGDESRQLVFIESEWAFVILVTLMALTHGYWSSLSMMYAPKQVDESKSQIVGMMSGFFLVFGIAMGILFTFIQPFILDLLGFIYHSLN